jgi:hypothetical protein
MIPAASEAWAITLGLGLAARWQREGIKRCDANALAQVARNDVGDRVPSECCSGTEPNQARSRALSINSCETWSRLVQKRHVWHMELSRNDGTATSPPASALAVHVKFTMPNCNQTGAPPNIARGRNAGPRVRRPF